MTVLSSVVFRKYQKHYVSSSQKDPITFFINPTKTCTYWSTDIVPLTVVSGGGLYLLGSPIGTPPYMCKNVNNKLTACDKTLALLHDISDVRTRFQLHRATRSPCLVQHLFRLLRHDFSGHFAVRFH